MNSQSLSSTTSPNSPAPVILLQCGPLALIGDDPDTAQQSYSRLRLINIGLLPVSRQVPDLMRNPNPDPDERACEEMLFEASLLAPGESVDVTPEVPTSYEPFFFGARNKVEDDDYLCIYFKGHLGRWGVRYSVSLEEPGPLMP